MSEPVDWRRLRSGWSGYAIHETGERPDPAWRDVDLEVRDAAAVYEEVMGARLRREAAAAAVAEARPADRRGS